MKHLCLLVVSIFCFCLNVQAKDRSSGEKGFKSGETGVLNLPVIELFQEEKPKNSKFITYVQSAARDMSTACYEMSKKAQKLGANAVYKVTSNGQTVGIRSTYVCYGEAVSVAK